MTRATVQMLAAMILVACMTQQLSEKKSAKQPFPEAGFWVAETRLHSKTTVVRYYADSNHLISEKIEDGILDVSRLSVRRYLNQKLKTELKKDSTGKSLPKLYEIN